MPLTDKQLQEAIKKAKQRRDGGAPLPDLSQRTSLETLRTGASSRQAEQQATDTAPQISEGFFSKLGGDIKQRGSDIAKTFGQAARGEISPVETAVRSIGDVAGAVGDVGAAVVGRGLAVADKVTDFTDVFGLKEEVKNKITESPMFKEGLEAIAEGAEAYESWKQSNERAAEFLEGFVNVASILPAIKGTQVAIKGTQVAGKVVKETAEAAVQTGARAVADIPGAVASKVGKVKDVVTKGKSSSIEEVISPGINAKETRKIVSEGRVKRGKESRLFGTRPDVIEQTDSVKRAAKTIERRIPDAGKLDDFALNDKLGSEVTAIAKELKPEMKKILLSSEIRKKMSATWAKLKKKQAGEPQFQNFPGSKTIQKKFEIFFNQMKKPVRSKDGRIRRKTMDDLWDIRKKYDGSISNSVKQATDASTEFKQLQKEMWLDNRQIMNDIIRQSSKGLDTSAAKAFSEMSDLYTARQNIIGKSKINKKKKPGLISQKTAAKAAVGAAAGAAGVSVVF